MLKNILNHRPSAEKLREKALMREYIRLLDKLEQLRTSFDYAVDSPEIDALIYEENAVLCRLRAIWNQAREMGLYVDLPETLNFFKKF